MSAHIALLGDSIFDNRRYTGTDPDVIAHLRNLLPPGWQASLLARDGSVIKDLAGQMRAIPPEASHLVVSIGGNDTLGQVGLLSLPVSSTGEALELFREQVEAFESAYRAAVQAVLAKGRSTTLCSIYNGNLDTEWAAIARMGLTMFNDALLRVAFEHQLPLIDLRSVCREPEDYANPIEPSGSGGRKIALAIARACGALEGGRRSNVYSE